MGLDWNPLNKPRPGSEQEFEELFRELLDGSELSKAQRERYEAISITPYETLGAPRVGKSEAANRWALERFEEHREAERTRKVPFWRRIFSKPPPKTKEEWLASMDGFYVVSLVEPCDGIPYYSNGSPGGYVEPFSFRAKFLDDCEAIIGKEHLDEAYMTKTAAQSLAYGDALAADARRFAEQEGLAIPEHSPSDHESAGFRLHVVMSAARWCRYWAARGHGLEAWF